MLYRRRHVTTLTCPSCKSATIYTFTISIISFPVSSSPLPLADLKLWGLLNEWIKLGERCLPCCSRVFISNNLNSAESTKQQQYVYSVQTAHIHTYIYYIYFLFINVQVPRDDQRIFAFPNGAPAWFRESEKKDWV